jgi:endonuclease/exonuclease/phosphatase family metal-dependent hydrolase
MLEKSSNSKWFYFLIIALNTLLGLEILKTFLSMLVNFFRERPSISLTDVAIYALVTFLLFFATGLLYKLRYSVIIWIFTAGVGITRFILQINTWPPLSLALSAAGTILWMAGFVFFISLMQQKRIGLLSSFFPGIIFGISLTTAIHGLFGTWDMVWRRDWHVIFFVLIIILVKLWLVYHVSSELRDAVPSDGGRDVFYSLIVFMPFVFLQLLKFQNVASLDAVTGKSMVFSLAIILGSNVLAFLFAHLYFFKKLKILLTISSAIFILLSFLPAADNYLYILQVVFGNIGACWLLMAVLNRAESKCFINKEPWKNTVSFGIGGLVFLIFAFIYYSSYDLWLPFENWVMPVSVAALISICAIVSSFQGNSSDKGGQKSISVKNYGGREPVFIYLMAGLLIIPLIMLLPLEDTDRNIAEDGPVRVMDYNIHQGFNIEGYLDLESIARVIEGSGADVVCLQEVSRGWLINGSADTLSWLSDRLDMDYLFMPASDDVWGNAILSRYPLKLLKSGFLPRMDAPLRRSYLLAEINIGNDENINLICTHLHHIKDEGWIRKEQVKALLEGWNGLGRTAVLGDFNADAGDYEVKEMHSAGFRDSQLELGEGDKLTWVHYEPHRRIDYIWVTEDLEISDVEVIYSTASDHLPVVININ